MPQPAQAQAKPSKTTAPTKPTGAGGLTGTSGIRLKNPAGAAGLTQKWQTFKAPGLELSLPENYRGGSPNTTGLQTLIKGIRSLGSDYEKIASMVEQNPETFLLIAVDPKPDVSGGITNVVVSAVKVPETVTVDAYLDAAMKSLPTPMRTIERKTVQVGQKPAGRLVTEVSVPSSTQADGLRQLIYVIKEGTMLWTVAYSTRSGDYQQRLAMFEQSIASFTVQSDQTPGSGSAVPKQPASTPGSTLPGSKPAQPSKPKPASTAPAQEAKPNTSEPASDRTGDRKQP
ncbi:hypothetical protein H6F76_06170 [Leptolyngbya sp. FACHB-321]|uniref:hypothetical protein n=1 Tax=Leptolyngbya sp. FACHB-321 TaxID=2692807 RepID=UPI0016855102|nr:hypothetical protein [Leptolyngbya sp. FACHB-321]MBD2034617.1 hypothetical protein [Leptolyngbya sp. FACHB-321]